MSDPNQHINNSETLHLDRSKLQFSLVARRTRVEGPHDHPNYLLKWALRCHPIVFLVTATIPDNVLQIVKIHTSLFGKVYVLRMRILE